VIDGRIDVTYVYPTGGFDAIEYAVQILEDGEVPPASVTLETEEVTADNAQDVLDEFTGGGDDEATETTGGEAAATTSGEAAATTAGEATETTEAAAAETTEG